MTTPFEEAYFNILLNIELDRLSCLLSGVVTL